VSLGEVDRSLLLAARTRGHSRAAERVVSALSLTGEHAALWLALGAWGGSSAAVAARRDRWWRGVRIVATAYGLNTALKRVVRRPRPQLAGLPPLTPTVSSLSFPSAHATTAFAAAAAYGGLLPRGPLYAVAVAFALSRPYLGVHYPSDVVAGAALGTVLARAWPAGAESLEPERAG
jgi:membrane-associated phospholipid phosphatase